MSVIEIIVINSLKPVMCPVGSLVGIVESGVVAEVSLDSSLVVDILGDLKTAGIFVSILCLLEKIMRMNWSRTHFDN